MDDEKKCFICNKEAMLALVGIGIGLVFIALSLDTLRRMRIESSQPNLEHYLEGGSVE